MIDFKIPIKKWTTEDLKMQLHGLGNKISVAFIDNGTTKGRLKDINNMIDDSEKIRKELESRGIK